MEVYGTKFFLYNNNVYKQMIKNKTGWTLIELLVAIAIFAIIIVIPYSMFVKTLKLTTQQYEISKSSIEKLPALEILRRDVETAGFGLPWNLDNKTYSEVNNSVSFPLYSSFKPSSFNGSSSAAPKAIDGNIDSGNGYSYLVLRASAFGTSKAANHWTYMYNDNGTEKINIWNSNSISNYNNLLAGDKVIVMSANKRQIAGNSLYYTISNDASHSDTDPSYYGLPIPPGIESVNYLIYGIKKNNDIAAPFNRIDYALYDEQTPSNICAQGTHTLGRILFNNNTNGTITKSPFLRCVADFQVWFGIDVNNSGKITWTQNPTSYSALEIRDTNQIKKVIIFILVQNGKVDKNYTFPKSSIFVGDDKLGIGRTFKFNEHGFYQTGLNSYKHYRWKLLELVIKPINLEGG